MIKNYLVTLFRLPHGNSYFEDREKWYVDRETGMSYYTDLSGEEAAEEAFHLTNAPEECLEEDQKRLLKRLEFRGPSLSTGDIVRVESTIRGSALAEYYLCKSRGWEKFDGDRFELLRHLS